jgi:hypothetical protein
MMLRRRCVAFSLVLALCLALSACGSKQQERIPVPTQGGKPILPGASQEASSSNDFTAVYVTVFEDTAIIATYPVLKNPDTTVAPEKVDPACPPRELSDGGNILCGGDHETDCPITRVIIADRIVPKSMSGWFRNMGHLQEIRGLEKVLTHHVTDMSYLFAGCCRLHEINIDDWDVSAVVDFTGMFQDCETFLNYPIWYDQGTGQDLD